MPAPPGPSRYALIAEATTAGLLFLVGPGAGYLLGKWAGGALELGAVPAWIGAALGLVSAFINLVRLTGGASR
ncbi:MAG: hypothetical protein WEB59_10125 [Thermoanaerobaculia bacterium]